MIESMFNRCVVCGFYGDTDTQDVTVHNEICVVNVCHKCIRLKKWNTRAAKRFLEMIHEKPREE